MPTFVSSLSASALASLIAFSVVAVLIGVIAWFMTKNSTVSVSAAMVLETPLLIVYFVSPATFEGAFQRVIYSISIFMRLYNFIEGIFDVGSVIFFLSAIFLFCFLTIQSLEKRRYS
jgi:ABC-2 type transport system permease protein